MSTKFSEIFKLSIPEKIILVEALWDSIANDGGEIGQQYILSKEQEQFLEEELIAYSQNPEEGSSWEEIKQRLLKK